MEHGFEVDWDVLEHAGRRLQAMADDVRADLAPDVVGVLRYGDADLSSAMLALARGWVEHGVGLHLAVQGFGDGLRASARTYSEADALGAVARFAMYTG